MAGLKKFIKKHGGKKGSASKEDLRSNADSELAFGYVIGKEKDLPKLHKAVWNRDTTKVKQLCKKADINQFDKENRTPLHLAAATGNDEITKLLLVNKAKSNLCDNDGRTALMKAIECSHNGCIELLLDHNADVKVTDANASSTLHLAAANNLIDIAALLLKKGINIDVSDKEGFTPLHVASSLGNQDFVLYLLNEHANIDCVDAHGRTPLMTAAADGHMDIVKMLLQHNANVALKDAQGWKAADHAVMNGIHSCAKIINDHELRQTQEKEKANEKAMEKTKEKTKETKEEPAPKTKKKPDIMEVLRSTSPVNDDLDFTFGGPAADKIANDGMRSEGSTSRQSDGDDSWGTDTEDEISESNKKSTKVSLAAALKKVERSESNLSKASQSRIPVRSPVTSPSANSVRTPEKVTSPQSSSKIPRPVSTSPPTSGGLPSPDKSFSPHEDKQNPVSPTSSKSASTGIKSPTSPGSGKNSPAVTSPQTRSRVVSPSESVRSGTEMQGRLDRRQSGGSLPLEYLKATEVNSTDSEQAGKKDVSKTHGYSPSFLSPRSDQSGRNLADELGLSLSGSDVDEDSVMSGEVSFDDVKHNNNNIDPEILTSTLEPKEGQNQSKENKNPAAYLGLDLDSPVSSVSDPDISGMSDSKRKKNEDKKSLESKLKQKKNAEDTDSNWDSSEGFLPSDNENEPEKSSKLPEKSKHDSELKAAVEKRRTTLEKSTNIENKVTKDGALTDEEESEVTESESEWAKGREETRKKELEKIKEQGLAQMKAEEDRRKETERKLQEEKEKEDQRRKDWKREQQEKEEQRQRDWEREQQEKEQELAKSIKKELEEELGIESDFRGSDEGSVSEVRSESQIDDDEGSLMGNDEHTGNSDVQNKGVPKNNDERKGISHEGPNELNGQNDIDVKVGKDILAQTGDLQIQGEVLGDVGKQRGIIGDFDEQESSQWDSSDDDENVQGGRGSEGTLENNDSRERRGTGGSQLSSMDNDSRFRADTVGSEGAFEGNENRVRSRRSTGISDGISEVISEDPEGALDESEDSFRSEDTYDDQQMNNNNIIKQPVLTKEEVINEQNTSVMESAPSPTREQGVDGRSPDTIMDNTKITQNTQSGSPRGNNGITGDARQLQKEEDDLLEAYKARQEEVLEQERRVEEEMAMKEQERLDEMRMQLQQRQEEEARRMAELERQKKERELAMQKEREEYENEMKRKQLERKMAEEERKRKEIERLEELKRREDESKARSEKLKSMAARSNEDLISPTDISPMETQAERLLTEKHRDFVDDVANTASVEIQKVQNRDRLADRTKEIKQRQLEAKADLQAVRLQTSKLNDPAAPNKWESSSLSPDLMAVSTQAEKLSHNSRKEVHSDWSTSSEDERDRPQSRAKTPLSSVETGLGSSLSPGRSISRPSLLQTAPLLSSSPAVLDNSPGVVQLKNSLRETKRQLEKCQEKLTLAETKVRQLEGHADDLQSNLEDAINQKSAMERELFETNEENRSLKHECLRSTEDKKIAEALSETVKDQMRRSEEKLSKEIKLRRAAEETGKQLDTKRGNLENALRHIAQEQEDLKKLLEREREQCRLKDELYKEQKKQNEAIILESQKLSKHRSEVLTKLESVDEDRKNVEASSESLREQLIHAKGEIGRLTSQLETLTKVSQSEVDLFKKQLAEQTEKNKQLEDNMAKARSDYHSQMSQVQAASTEQQNKLESEIETRHGLQSEAMVLRSRLESTENERNEANKTRADAERQLHSLRDEMYKSKTALEKEVSSLKEANQMITMKLNTAENKISSLEAELQTANIMLAERSSQMTINMHDVDNKRASITKLESDLRTEKDKNARISARLETTTDRMKDLENEAVSLRCQLDLAAEKVRKQEENSHEAQKKLNSTISEMKTDHEKTKGKISEKEQRLTDAVEKYKEEMQQNFIKLQKQDDNIRSLHQELAEATRKLSSAEASLEVQLKARDDLEKERDHLRQTLRTYEEQMTVRISENHLVSGHASVLQNELDHSRKVSEETSERLATTAFDLDSLQKMKAGLEGNITKLKADRVKLEATLQEEKAKTNLLLKEIKDNNEGRTHLESLLSHIKSSNIDLEQQLRTESLDKTQYAREAEEAKSLWEAEVRSRSKLGAKILEIETQLNESKTAIDEEKKKVRKALESRKVMQGKLDIYEKRADQHEKEVQTLKTQIRSYKRRLKDVLDNEKRIPAFQAQFNRESQQYEATIASLRNQLRDVDEKLREEGDSRALAQRREQLHEKDLILAKTQAKDLSRQIQKLEKLNEQMADDMDILKGHYSENFVNKAELDRIKLDLEAKSRIELNRKLADVNAHLEEQALTREVLDRSRNEKEEIKIKELEETILKLRRENELYRSKFQQLQVEKETVEVEAEKFKDMYKTETKRKEKLNNLLFQEREKSAESKALLNFERSRSDKILGNTGIDRLEHSPSTLDTPVRDHKSPGRMYSQPKEKFMEAVDKELSKSIQRHLDSISTSDGVDLWANKDINMTSSPMSTSSRQYMETLKRNYFV